MIVLVDYGASNLASVRKALEFVGLEVETSGDPNRVMEARGVVFPGQGEFGSGYRGLVERGLVEPLRRYFAADRPFLGICLGLQLLFEGSEESPGVSGLGILTGACRRFQGANLTVPHMGWNQVRQTGVGAQSPWLKGIPDGAHFYFVHSYYPVPADSEAIAATTDYGPGFASMVVRGRLGAMQFHPEKSQQAGLQLLKNFRELCERG